MDKQLKDNGFTVIEMMMCLLLMTVLLSLSVPIVNRKVSKPINMEINDIVLLQYKAIMENEKTQYQKYECNITFNRKGNINKANTYYIDEIGVIVSLGTGRVYVKEK